jgi:dGTPase
LSEYLLDQRPPLEAQLIDLADEIAYDTADLDDGYEAHLLKLEDLRAGLPTFESFFQDAKAAYPDAPEKLKFNESLKRILNRFVGDLIENTRAEISHAGVKNLEDVRRLPHRLAQFSPEVEKDRREFKKYLYSHLYFSSVLNPEKVDAGVVIGELFSLWMKRPELLPHNYREKAEQEELPRVICDYIAGMTDTYIYEQYEKHLGTNQP